MLALAIRVLQALYVRDSFELRFACVFYSGTQSAVQVPVVTALLVVELQVLVTHPNESRRRRFTICSHDRNDNLPIVFATFLQYFARIALLIRLTFAFALLSIS